MMKDKLIKKTDMPKESWIYKTPTFFHSYLQMMRLDRPIGIWLLLFPCLWSLFASSAFPYNFLQFKFCLLFFVGSVVMRGAGCVVNDIVDRNIDKKVARTALRPLASGKIKLSSAFVFLFILLLIGFIVLMQFNKFTIILGVSSLIMVLIYPFVKRFSYFPQLWLGLTFNWGALLGYSCITNNISFSAFAIYLSGCFWTLGYDTIYAHQDKEDDVLAGVKSTALKFKDKSRLFISLFYFISLVFLAVSIYLLDLDFRNFLFISFPAVHLFWQIKNVDFSNPSDCLEKFKSNKYTGLLFLLAYL